jgi:hypothetical protein
MKGAQFVATGHQVAAVIEKINASVKKSTRMTQGAGAGGGMIAGLDNLVKSVTRAGSWVINQFQNMANAVRLFSQGVMTAGKMLTFALTPAALGVLVWGSRVAIEFDDALVRVSKTTGNFGDRLQEVATGIRDLAITTSTGVVELAKLAEQIGQTGVREPEQIVRLVTPLVWILTQKKALIRYLEWQA